MNPRRTRVSSVHLVLLSALVGAAGWSGPMADAPFPHGVASGDVTDHSAVVWTRAGREGDLSVEIYPAERAEILRFIRKNRLRNVIFLTTDFHVNLIDGLYVDRFVSRRPVAMEFVAGPIAELTLEEELRYFSSLLLGLDPDRTMKVISFIVQFLDTECWDLGGARPLLGGTGVPRFTYGLVEVDGESGEATISIKDRFGNVIPDKDPRDPGEFCARMISPEGRVRMLKPAGPGARRRR
jgi:hypothetical protein